MKDYEVAIAVLRDGILDLEYATGRARHEGELAQQIWAFVAEKGWTIHSYDIREVKPHQVPFVPDYLVTYHNLTPGQPIPLPFVPHVLPDLPQKRGRT